MRKSQKIRIIILTIFILGVFPITLYLILITPSNIGFINRSDVAAWIGYYAAILGGALTLLGVYATIRNHEISKKEEKAIQFKPILELASDSEIPSLIPYREIGLGVTGYSCNSSQPHKYIMINSKEKETFFFVIKNKGRGETSKAILKPLEVSEIDLDWTEGNRIFSSYSESYIGEIVSNEYCKILLHLPKYILVKKSIDHSSTLVLNTTMKIQYNDMFDVNSYMYILDVRFLINLDEKDFEEVTTDYIAIRASYCLGQVMQHRENTML